MNILRRKFFRVLVAHRHIQTGFGLVIAIVFRASAVLQVHALP